MTRCRFETKEEFEDFINNSNTCLCGKMLTGLHEMMCPKIQKMKVKFLGKQDEHPILNIPKVTNQNDKPTNTKIQTRKTR